VAVTAFLFLVALVAPLQVLYIPRGFLHEGETPKSEMMADTSIHLTFSPETITWVGER
jgi:hypothetical protein